MLTRRKRAFVFILQDKILRPDGLGNVYWNLWDEELDIRAKDSRGRPKKEKSCKVFEM